jgi:hypothetical protein
MASQLLRPRLFISSTSQDLKETRRAIIETLSRSGIFYHAMEEQSAIPGRLEDHLRSRIASCDLLVLLVGERAGELLLDHKTIVEFEFECAVEMNKPILAYLSDDGMYGSFPETMRRLKERIIEVAPHYGRLAGSPDAVAFQILADVSNAVASYPGLNGWVRADMSKSDIEKILSTHEALQDSLRLGANLIQEHCSTVLNAMPREEREQLRGPLADAGIFPNLRGSAYSFAKRQEVIGEINRLQLSFTYSLDRFRVYESGAVYDHDLDLTWLVVQNHTCSWDAAVALPREHSRLASIFADQESILRIDWRLPHIEELMTLITRDRMGNGYLDETALPGALPWIWSGTESANGRAYYIEFLRGQVLYDYLEHRKGVVLCAEGAQDALGQLARMPVEPSVLRRSAKARYAALSLDRIYSVYVRTVSSHSLQDDYSQVIRDLLRLNGYDVILGSDLGATLDTRHQPIRVNPALVDHYLLVLDGSLSSVDPVIFKEVREEASLMADHRRGIIVLHGVSRTELNEVKAALGLPSSLTASYQYVKRENLLGSLIATLRNQIEVHPREGWVYSSALDAVNNVIAEIDSGIGRLEQYEDSILHLLDVCGQSSLAEDLRRLSIIAAKPAIGEKTVFVSRHNSIERFISPAKQGEQAIFYERLPERFAKFDEAPAGSTVLVDSYLELLWRTSAEKYQTYPQSIESAHKLSVETGLLWRLPTVHELMTLIPRTRGGRKYMDEDLFPTGRWFWSSTLCAGGVYYLDYNYPLIGVEDVTEDLAVHLRKSVLLVASSPGR